MRIIKSLLIATLVFITACGVSAQKYKYKTSRNYEVVMLGVGTDGTKAFQIYTTEKSVEKAIALAKKAAVEICIFKGLPSAGTVSATPAMCDYSTEEQHSDYFEEFFTPGGQYLRYVNITTDGVPSGQDRLKVKGGYKVGLKVQILYDDLRRDLEKAGIVKPLDYGF